MENQAVLSKKKKHKGLSEYRSQAEDALSEHLAVSWHQVSNEEKRAPGCLGYRLGGWNTEPSYVGIISYNVNPGFINPYSDY